MASRINNLAPIGSLFKSPRLEKPHKKIRSNREEDPKHLIAIRQCPCVVCGEIPCDAAHVRMSSGAHGKPNTPMGQKPSDRFTVPLCRRHHREQHDTGELTFWHRLGISPFLLCAELYAKSPDVEKMKVVVLKFQRKTS